MVLGGLGDMTGALIAALIVAAVEIIGSYTIGTAWKEVLYLLLFIAILDRAAGGPVRAARRRGARRVKTYAAARSLLRRGGPRAIRRAATRFCSTA